MSIQHTDIAFIGSGFGGIGIAIQLQHAGMHNIVLLEKASDVGGCWRDNSYPGAACDVPSHLYSFSFEPKFDWSRKFAPQREIYAYIRHAPKNTTSCRKYSLIPKSLPPVLMSSKAYGLSPPIQVKPFLLAC